VISRADQVGKRSDSRLFSRLFELWASAGGRLARWPIRFELCLLYIKLYIAYIYHIRPGTHRTTIQTTRTD